jgi:hypothetical protein
MSLPPGSKPLQNYTSLEEYEVDFPTLIIPAHPDFDKLLSEIHIRIDSQTLRPEREGFSLIQHNTLREAQVISSFQDLLKDAAAQGIPISDLPPSKRHLRNRSNTFDVRRALIMEDCDDMSVFLLESIKSNSVGALSIFRFVTQLQTARQLYAALPNIAKD